MVLYHSSLSASSIIPLAAIINLDRDPISYFQHIYIAHQPISTISIAEYTEDKVIIATHKNPINAINRHPRNPISLILKPNVKTGR